MKYRIGINRSVILNSKPGWSKYMHDAAFSRACDESEIHVAYCNFRNRFYINDITFVPTIIYTYVTYIVTFVTSYTPSTSLGTLYAAMVFGRPLQVTVRPMLR